MPAHSRSGPPDLQKAFHEGGDGGDLSAGAVALQSAVVQLPQPGIQRWLLNTVEYPRVQGVATVGQPEGSGLVPGQVIFGQV